MDPHSAIPAEALRRKRLRLTRADTARHGDLPPIDGLIDASLSDDGTHLNLTYDVRLIALDDLTARLRERGAGIATGGLTRLRIAWQSYLDRNARANLQHPGSPCCSNPTTVYASRRRRRENGG